MLAALVVHLSSWAQVVIDDSMTPEELVQEVLLGSGVAVFNIEVTGNIPANEVNQQFGKYIGPSNVIGFDSGMMMTTGNVLGAAGGLDGTNGANNVQNDPDLMMLSGQNMNNCAILEFDFVPNGDSLEFRYVFGSAEYPNFTCSQFNDVFGFFISGPGIDGPFSNNAENIAIIPGTDTPVGINTVNSGSPSNEVNFDNCFEANPNFVADSIYFVANPGNPEDEITIPGLTVTMTAFANVTCGETYHIKLAIANAVDQALQSYVFLESESFSSNSAVQVSLDIPVGINDSTLYRGCGDAKLEFIRPLASSGVQEVAYLNIGGTAVNGVDVFPILPDSIVFPPGVDTVSFNLTAPFTGQAVGQMTFDITITNIASDCGGAELVSNFTIYINDAQPLQIEPGGSFELEDCNDEVWLVPEVSGGYGEYRFTWSNGATADSILVSPGFTNTFFVTVSDTCNAGSVSTSFDVEVPQYPPVIVELPEDLTLEVCDEEIVLSAEVEGGFGTYSYLWRDMNTNQIIGQEEVLEHLVGSTTTIRLLVTDDCGATGFDDIEITIPPVDVSVMIPPNYEVTSCLQEVMMPANSSGGIGTIVYSWFGDGNLLAQTTNAFFLYNPTMGNEVVIRAEDECGNFDQDTTYVEFNYPEVVVIATPDTSICERTDALLRLEAFGGLGSYVYQWKQSGKLSDTLRVAPRQNTRYDYVVRDTCGTRTEGRIWVRIREVEAMFEYDRLPYYGIQIRNQSIPLIGSKFLWDFGDGQTSTEEAPKHQFNGVEAYTIHLTVQDAKGCEDTFSRTTTPPVEIFVPTAFTPDGDGLNELFKVQGSNIRSFEIWIYDRWGRQVFHSKDMDEGWNGSHQGGEHHNNLNVYNYLIRYQGMDVEDTYEKTGTITVVR